MAKFTSAEKLRLEPRGTTVTIDLGERGGAAILQAARGRNSRVYLAVQGIEYQQNPGAGYEILLNAPAGIISQVPQSAGVLHFYGLKEAAQASGQPAEAQFDITDAIRELQKTNRWNNRQLSVTFARRAPISGTGQEDTSQSSSATPTFRGLEIRVQ